MSNMAEFFSAALMLFMGFGQTAMPTQWKDPGYANLVWIQSPHFDARPPGTIVDTVVLHSTVTPTLEETTKWFQNPKAEVSAHFTIGKDGSIVQNVSTFDRAWHAGVSKDIMGREKVNAFSVGIELVNLNDGKDPYPQQQVLVTRFLIGHLKKRFPLRYITSHEYIAQPFGRKSDPRNFPWHQLNDLGLELVHR